MNKEQFIIVFSDYYVNTETKIVDSTFFNEQNGYENSVIHEIDNMAIGENFTADNGNQRIYRTK